MYSFTMLTKKELSDIVYKGSFPILKIDENNAFVNFYYFSYEDLNNQYENPMFIIAYKNKLLAKNIIGVIKFDTYGTDIKYKAINYIDVNVNYRNKEIAKNMIKTLNNHLTSKDVLVGTKLSEEGKKCNIDTTFKRLITNCKYYDTSEELYKEFNKL